MTYEQNRAKIAKTLEKYPELMTIKETVKALRCGEKSLRSMLADGILPHVMIAQRYLIVRECLIDYIVENSFYTTQNGKGEYLKEKCLAFCKPTAHTDHEIATHLGISIAYCRSVFLQNLVTQGKLATVFDNSTINGATNTMTYITVQKDGDSNED